MHQFEVTLSGPVPAEGTARSRVRGQGRGMRFGVTFSRFQTIEEGLVSAQFSHGGLDQELAPSLPRM